MKSLLIGLAPFLLILMGCQSPENILSELSVKTPRNWPVPSDNNNPISENWWIHFKDEQLSALVDEALRENTDLKRSAKRLELARAQSSLLNFSSRPQVSLSVAGDKKKSNFIGLPFGGGDIMSSRSESYSLNLSTIWEMDLWGRIRSSQKAARLTFSASEMDYAAAQHSLAAHVVKSWLLLCEARIQTSLTKELIQIAKTVKEQAGVRYQLGRGTASDVRLSEANLASVTVQFNECLLNETRFARSLEIILGRYPDGRIAQSETLPEMPGTIPIGVPSQILTRRPDIAASVFRVRAADARIAEGKAGLLPQVSLTNSAGTSSNQLKDLINGNFLTWAIGSSITQNILLRDDQKERVHERELLAQEEALNHRDIVMNAFREVENALNKSAYLSEQHKHQRSVANGTSDLLVLAKNRFDVGTGSLRKLVESQNRFIESKMRLTTINKLELENRVDLHLALGGGFNPKRSDK